jgi:hypothetical protein
LKSVEPLILRGLVSHWPVVEAARRSAAEAMTYLRGFYRDATVGVWYGPPDIRGRFFYNDDLSGFNYRGAMSKLSVVLDTLERHREDAEPPAVYVGSTTVDTCLPGFRQENDVTIPAADALASIWIGNRTRIAAHYDVPDNVACVAVGRRRFTLFPPAQLPNLYVGPLELTPAGQPISLVDVVNPDLTRFPRFAEALRNARVAELEAGDAIFIPSLWWHHVEALDAFNVLVNYWWRRSPPYLGAPVDVLMHALLSLRWLPPEQREAWRGILAHYVFDADDSTAAHIPERSRGILGSIDEVRARELRALLLNRLNR